MRILLNQWNDPKLPERIWVGKGDKVYADYGAEEFGFTVGKEYIIQDVNGDLVMENDKGETDSYSSDYFTKYKPIEFFNEHKYRELANKIEKEYTNLCSKQPCGECMLFNLIAKHYLY